MLAKVRREAPTRARSVTQSGWLWICLVVSCGARTDLNAFKATLEGAQGGYAQSAVAGLGAVDATAQGGSRNGSGGSVGLGGTTSGNAGQAGVSACDSGTTLCGIGRRAFCAHLERDPANCGQCERACSSNEYCSNGTCRLVQPCTGVLELGGWPEVPVPTTWSHCGMVPGDWNSDGQLDLAVADGRGAVNVLLGKGNGTFPSRVAYPTADAPYSVGRADLNGDGHPDLVTFGGEAVNLFYGQGDGSFTVGPRYDAGKASNQWDCALALGDLNGDGLTDVVVAQGASVYGGLPRVTEASVSVLFGAADGTLRPSSVVFTAVMGTPEIAIGDVNGDGALDLAVAGTMGPDYYDPGKLTVLYGHGDGSFASPVETLNLPSIGAVAVSDLNLDGNADVILAGQSYGLASDVTRVSVLLGQSDNTLAPRLDYGKGTHWGPALIAAELSGDAFPDVAVTGWGTFDVLLGKGDGSFAPAVAYGSGFHPTSAAVGDVNGDNVTDLLVADESTMAVSVLLGEGYGAFVNPGWAKSLWYPEPAPATPCPSGFCVPQLIADLNRDGWADMVASECGGVEYSNRTSLCVLHGQGDGTFVQRANYQFPFNPQSVFQAELNDDAWPDLVVTTYDSSGSAGTVSVLVGQADGEFKRGNDYRCGGTHYLGKQVALGDLNGDGLTDLVTLGNATADSPGKATAWLGNGDATFREWREIIAINGFGSVAIGDLNGDGLADVAVSDAEPDEPGRVSVLFGRGQGLMAAPLAFSVDTFPGFLSIADLNGDGWGDLVMTHSASDAVGVLFGRGNGQFSAEVEYYTDSLDERSEVTRSSPGPIAIVDLDSDGALDIAVANFGLGTVGVFAGHKDGTFSYIASYGTATDPNNQIMQGLASGDLNGDGRRDVIVGKPATVLMNACR